MSEDFHILDREKYGELFVMLLNYCGFNSYGSYDGEYEEELTKCGRFDSLGDYESDVFSLHPFCWCDKCSEGMDGECPRYDKPNFHYKPTDFRLNWYKYPLRGNDCNRDITVDEFVDMINHCSKDFWSW